MRVPLFGLSVSHDSNLQMHIFWCYGGSWWGSSATSTDELMCMHSVSISSFCSGGRSTLRRLSRQACAEGLLVGRARMHASSTDVEQQQQQQHL